MATDATDQQREIAAFYDEVIRDLDRRLARIERSRHYTYPSVPAWRHLTERRAHFLRLQAESLSFELDTSVDFGGTRLRLEPGQIVIPHGVDRHLDVDDLPPNADDRDL